MKHKYLIEFITWNKSSSKVLQILLTDISWHRACNAWVHVCSHTLATHARMYPYMLQCASECLNVLIHTWMCTCMLLLMCQFSYNVHMHIKMCPYRAYENAWTTNIEKMDLTGFKHREFLLLLGGELKKTTRISNQERPSTLKPASMLCNSMKRHK